MDLNIIKALLDRYLKGETSHQENELIEHWLNENDNPDAQWRHLKENQKDRWLTNVFGQIQDSIQVSEPKVTVMPQKVRIWRYVAGAAAVLAICFTLRLEWPALQSRLNPAELAVVKVPLNQQKLITLADGSKVWINAGSQLRYPKRFKGKKREVYLSGEAYFDIRHDVEKTFIIYTGDVVTTVLGTAFDIREDKSSHTIKVTVARGKVNVANGDKQLGILTPNQQISFNVLNHQAIQTEVDAEQAIAWQKSELHFEDITFAQAARQLEQRFNVKINFSNNKVKSCRFTGTALKGERLEKILKVICSFNNATYQTKADGSIIINGNGCS